MDRRSTAAASGAARTRAINEDLDLAEIIGVDTELRAQGGHLVGRAPWRDDTTPSLHVWPPGTGRYQDGWTWYDFGERVGGTVVGYLCKARGLSYEAAVEEAWRLHERQSGVQRTPIPRPVQQRPAPRIANGDLEPQRRACAILALVLADTGPAADDYLRRERGLDPAAARSLGDVCAVRSREHAVAVGQVLHGHPDRALLLATGVIKDGLDAKARPRWMCWDRALLIGCRDEAGAVVAWRARRCEWRPEAQPELPKYVNQSGDRGCHPFAVAALQQAAAGGDELIVVEGALDAVGARMLGRLALAMNTRPGTTTSATYAATAQAHWFAGQASALRACRRVLVLPDADHGKGYTDGLACAETLVAYLRGLGVTADRTTMDHLCYGGAKDLAEAADCRRQAHP